MIMLKDNHIDFCGGITKAVDQTREYLSRNRMGLKIIVEARSMDEIREILTCEGVYRILIDNFSPEETKEAVELIGGRCLTESSGGITLQTLRSYAEAGVDYISSGALTHSVHNMDLSLKAF
jgi:nicotinate-nucleotide pyrophosphorylase (carboxylating)